MNELTDKIWAGIEMRLVDIKHAATDQAAEAQRYVFGVPKSKLASLGGDSRNFLPKICSRRH